MKNIVPPDPDPALDAREAAILKSVIQEHILTGAPVGSKKVSGGVRLDLSPATIRGIMADLEERGLLVQPHTSAGRLPTDRAYRLYVDRLMRRSNMNPSRAQVIDAALFASRGEIADLLGEASKQLSKFSRQVGVVLAPAMRRVVVEKLEFARLNERRIVAILVGRSGVVHNRILDLDEPMSQEELDRTGRYLTDQFGGMTLLQMRTELENRMKEERAAYDRLLARSLKLGRRTIEEDEDNSADLFVEGASNLLDSPEFADLGKMKKLIRTLEEKRRLIGLLSRVLDQDGVQVMIGSENQEENLNHCTVVASNYHSGDRVMGTLGIVGPTRMEYVKAIGLVEHLAVVLTRLLTHPDMENP
jgi:heat-inducible transcriptional repressor